MEIPPENSLNNSQNAGEKNILIKKPLSAILTHKGGFVREREFIERHGRYVLEKIFEKFTVSTYSMSYVKTVKLYVEKKGYIIFPRFALFKLYDAGIIDIINNEFHKGKEIDCEFDGELREHQTSVINHLMKNVYNEGNIKRGNAGCILSMEAGYGKTHAAMGLINIFKTKTLVIVPSTTIVFDQWVSSLKSEFPDSKIGEYSGKKHIDGDIIVCIINTALSDKIKPEWFRQFGLVIYDEIHKYCSEKHGMVFYLAQAPRVFGITATIERPDHFEPIAINQIGSVIKATSIEGFHLKDVKFTGNVDIMMYYGPPEYTKPIKNRFTNKIMTQKMCEQFIKDPYRNELIILNIMNLHKHGKNVFIFSERRDHLDHLQVELIRRDSSLKNEIGAPELDGGDSEIKKVSKLMGGIDKNRREIARTKSSIILMTYGFGDVGVSIPRMDALILATPRRSLMTQKIGRIFRLDGNTDSYRQIIDIVDAETSLKNQLTDRKKAYGTRDLTLNIHEIKYTDLDIQFSQLD